MKDGIRVLGVDDSPFSHDEKEVFLTGVVYRGTEFIEEMVSTDVKVDGDDATEKVIELFRSCSNTRQIKAVLVDGVSLAGFNVVDLKRASERIDRPVIAVTSNEPRPEAFRDAMEQSGNDTNIFDQLPDYSKLEKDEGTVYFQFGGCPEEKAEEIIRSSTLHGLVPEPVRVAHMTGRAFRNLL